MDIGFKIINIDNSKISIEGYVNMEEDSDFCLNFYDEFGDICFRIPINPFVFYTDEYYDYLDVVYAFETDENFMEVLKEFAESGRIKSMLERPGYHLVLKKIIYYK